MNMNSCGAVRGSLFFSLVPFALAWLLPNHYFPWALAYQEFLSFTALLLLLLLVFSFSRLRIPLLSAACFLLALIPPLQYGAGSIYFSGDAWIAAVYIVGFALAMAIGYSLARDSALRVQLAVGMSSLLVAAGLLSVWIALHQWFSLPGSIWMADMPPGGRPYANLAQPNNLATLLCMALAGVLFLYEKAYLQRCSGGFLAVFFLFGVALTQSRTPWLGGLFALIFFFWKSKACQLRLGAVSFAGLLALYVAFVATLPGLSEMFLLSPQDGALVRAGALERLDLWRQLWSAVWVKPWGYGWNQVSVAQVAVTLAYPVELLTEHSHNVLLDLLLWNGPVLGGAVICLMAAWLWRLVWRERTVEGFFALFSVGFVLVHAMLEFPLEYAFFLLPVGLMLGLAAAGETGGVVYVVPRYFVLMLFLIGVSLLCVIWREYGKIEVDHRLMRFENLRIGDERAVDKSPDVMVLTQLSAFLSFARTPASVNMTDDELELMRKVAHRYPYVSSIYRYAFALVLNGRVADAREQLLILRALHGDKHYAEGVGALLAASYNYPAVEELLRSLP